MALTSFSRSAFVSTPMVIDAVAAIVAVLDDSVRFFEIFNRFNSVW